MLSFNNTKIAFANKSDLFLKKSYWLFKLVSIGWLNKIGTTLLEIALKLNLPVIGMVKATVFEHFCGGESIEDCEPRIQELMHYNVKTILDYSVEGKQKEKDFDEFLGKAVASVERASKDKSIPFCVFKMTALIPFDLLKKYSAQEQMTEEESMVFLRGRNRADILCNYAYNAGIPIMIDAEESWIQVAIDEIALILMHRYNQQRAIVYNTAQLYRHDRLQYIKELYDQSMVEDFYIGLKIVRGAYMEKERARAKRKGYEDPIQPNKEATDKDYNLALEFCLDHMNRIALCCGTHNEESSLLLTQMMKERDIPVDNPQIYFSQLLGMSDHISFNLSKENYNVAKYVPYGPVKEVMPYLIRRAEENTSVSGQTSRELTLIEEELERRKKEN
ncbi:MAG: proline dehydrogenase family protein [Vicingaceae bacterium]